MKKKGLYDNHGRLINYLRLAVTDRCNLRCFYCMPEKGIDFADKKELFSYEEMRRTVQFLVTMGIEKLRITGGEPFVRKDMMDFLYAMSKLEDLKKINITTNGTLTEHLVPEFKKLRIHSVNLSLDTIDRERFHEITRRDELSTVLKTLDQLLYHGIDTKINTVVMEGKNTEDIIPMVELARELPVNVRFIEEMPFNGSGDRYPVLNWNHHKILDHIRQVFPDLYKIEDPLYSTSANYHIPMFKGTFGIIAAYSRTFCGTCNRLRITSKGLLKTCLYDSGIFNIKDMMRAGATDAEIKGAYFAAIENRAKDGWEAENLRLPGNEISESMTSIGG
ncbi:MAG: GTP 3',8-cyclase MoaA [Saprospiraceae bacterium]|nr:GTP 3',8-cyclase MoaA [Saprospiraceae bacterium]MCB9324879.1 GTP 3',8-cyclase MoaA [Lewinellaceae bacterium]